MPLHQWKMLRPDQIDYCAWDVDDPESFGGHNGPACTACGDIFCHHCEPDRWERITEGREDPGTFPEDRCVPDGQQHYLSHNDAD